MAIIGTRTYHYDAENRLVRVGLPLWKESRFAYDGFGRRVRQEEKSSSLSKVNPLLWCGASICRSVGVDDFIVRRYYPQGELRGAQRLYYARDHLDSVREVWDLDSNLARSAANFDPYGVRTGSYGELRTYGYAGMWQHAPTTLNLTWYRAYHPAHGRWTSPDPIGEAGGVNLYAYVENNPLTRIDPTGLDWIYSQSTGNLSYQPPASQGGGPPAPVASGGYSGSGAGYNNPSRQNVPNVGPIPQGGWTIGTPYNSPKVGPFAIPLTPNPGTNDFGRTDFRIHGDNSCMCGTASEGCVIFNRNVRNKIINSGDRNFIVVP